MVGGGGHCKSVIEAAESAGFRIHGVLDIPEHIGQTVLSGRIIGTDDDLADYVSEYDFVVTVGFIKNASLRLKIHDKIRAAGGRLATIIASTAYVSKYASVGEGTVILHQAVRLRLYYKYIGQYRTRCRRGRLLSYINRSHGKRRL